MPRGLQDDHVHLLQQELQWTRRHSLVNQTQGLTELQAQLINALQNDAGSNWGSVFTWHDATGVDLDASGDLNVFLGTLVAVCIAGLLLVLLFSLARRHYPEMYANNVRKKERGGFETAPFAPSDSFFGWIPAGLFVTFDQVVQTSGVDAGMLIAFCQFAMELIAVIGLPAVFILGPLHLFCGGGHTHKLGRLGLHNVKEGSWLWWVHAFAPWYVVIVTELMVFRAMRKFLPVRFKWLLDLEPPRSTTVLVEGLPESQCSDKALRQFYDRLFPGCVEHAEVVKHTEKLEVLVKELKATKLVLEKLIYKRNEQQRGRRGRRVRRQDPDEEGMEEEITKTEAEVTALQEQCRKERERILREAALPMVEEVVDGYTTMALQPSARNIYASSGFVTFTSERETMLALEIRCSPDHEEFMLSIPPQPSDVIYDDLRRPLWQVKLYALIGYGCIVGLFFSYIPFIMAISSFTNIRSLERKLHWIHTLITRWPISELLLEGILSTLALVLFMSFLPDVLMFIFSNFFSLKAYAWSQLRLQRWYFTFLFVFVILITAISGSFIQRVREVIWSPPTIFSILANSLPQATHFYLNFIVMQWGVHCLNITRYYNMFFYLSLRAVLDKDRAVELSEPEPQGYEGIGGRSARFTLNLTIALVFSTFHPMILIVTLINFLICRTFYAYLVTFAETRKHDLGGQFFVQQLWNVQCGLVIYVLLMCGVMARHGGTGHVVVCATSSLYLVYSMHRFNNFAWEKLPFAEWCTEDAVAGAAEELEQYRALGDRRPRYIQPELCEDKWKVCGSRKMTSEVRVYEPRRPCLPTDDSNARAAERLSVWAANAGHSKDRRLSTQIFTYPRIPDKATQSMPGSQRSQNRPAGSSRKNLAPVSEAPSRRRSGNFGA